jgi:hypothetical protein
MFFKRLTKLRHDREKYARLKALNDAREVVLDKEKSLECDISTGPTRLILAEVSRAIGDLAEV